MNKRLRHPTQSMERPLTAMVCDAVNLDEAFARFARARGFWRKGVPMRAAVGRPVRHMLELEHDLRRGTYRPEDPLRIEIAKADGTQRTISVYAIRDRVAQRAVLNAVQRVTDPKFADSSFGFRPGRGVHRALVRARSWLSAGYGWVVDTDIRHCFDSIPRHGLLDRVARIMNDRSAATLVAACMGWQADCDDIQSVGIPQGSCLAPWLCNVYLSEFDWAMHRQRIPLVRYADDLLLFARSQQAAETALGLARSRMDHLALSLHPLKTRVTQAEVGEPVKFLGAMLTAMPRLSHLPLGTGAATCW